MNNDLDKILLHLKPPRFSLKGQNILVFLGLTVAALAGNYFNISLFFGVDFLFGSIATLLITYLFGTAWGTLGAVLSNFYTLILWGHPYSMILLNLEILWVGIGLRRSSLNMVALTFLYWLGIGLPLGIIIYVFILQIPNQLTLLVVLKLTINGVFNALIASTIIVNTPLLEILSQGYRRSFPFRQTLFNSLLSFTIIPVLILIVVGSRVQFENLETEATEIVQAVSEEFRENLEITQTYRWGDLNLFEALLEAKRSPYPIQVFLLNHSSVVKKFPETANLFNLESGVIAAQGNNIYHWKPGGSMALMAQWRQSYYYTLIQEPGLPWDILVSLPAEPIVSKLQAFYIRNLVILLGIMGLAVISANALSRYLIQPLSQLADVSGDIPKKVSEDEPLHLPKTEILEFNLLSANFQMMAEALGEKFKEIKTANEELEQRVIERTKRLSEANQTLAAEIQERQRIETEIRKSQQRLALMVEQTPLGVLEWNMKFEVVSWNPAAERIFGYTAEEAIGTRIADRIVPPEWAFHVQQVMADLIARKGGARSTNDNIRKDGQRIICQWYNTPLISQAGDCIGIASMIQDITEQQRAEVELRESEQRFRDVSEAAGEYLWEIDLEGGYTYLSERVEAVKGYPVRDLLGRSPFEIMYGGDRPRVQELLNQAITHHSTFKTEYRNITPQGDIVWEEVNGVPRLDEQGNLIGFRGAGLSITDRKRSELELRQSEARLRQKAEELEQALRELQHTQSQLVQSEKMSSLGQLVAGVAHEINNPVNFIYGNLTHAEEYVQELLAVIASYQAHYPDPVAPVEEQLQDSDVEFLVEDFPQLINSMREGARRIREIVASLRNFSRLDEADSKLANIHEGIDNSLMILQSRLKQKGDRPEIQVLREYGQISPIDCYPGQLNQVFMNILANSIDALEERDRDRPWAQIREHPSCIWITTQQQGDRVRISIRDNGQGIPEAVRENIFNPFFTTKAVGKGTGLGLSISYQIIVERHGGKIDCHSTLGAGTEFLLEIPVRLGH
ncbi:PAS domain S-box protein [Sodalinema gerasimenkoae]|uniref:PAS domain S-box protein n=1 Tax=Sodalinema gerasimenkoae TaxID=2862348 RepID=UPI0013585706|nr:PAS domain S-box protein [Sodalinema gerasimenkoae]